jgi:ADP-ribose diphosphatase
MPPSTAQRPRFRVLRTRTIYQGRVLSLNVDEVEEPGGVRAQRELVVHPGSVVVMPCLADGSVILVRQFRYAAQRILWEMVAGSLKPGEAVLAAARRELAEETGYRARRLRRLASFYPSPGFLSEQMHLVAATGLRAAQARPEPDERIEVGRFSRARLKRMAAKGVIQDGKTLAALLWLFAL